MSLLKKSHKTEKNPKKSERKALKTRQKSQKIQAKIIEFGNVLCPEKPKNTRKIPEKTNELVNLYCLKNLKKSQNLREYRLIRKLSL